MGHLNPPEVFAKRKELDRQSAPAQAQARVNSVTLTQQVKPDAKKDECPANAHHITISMPPVWGLFSILFLEESRYVDCRHPKITYNRGVTFMLKIFMFKSLAFATLSLTHAALDHSPSAEASAVSPSRKRVTPTDIRATIQTFQVLFPIVSKQPGGEDLKASDFLHPELLTAKRVNAPDIQNLYDGLRALRAKAHELAPTIYPALTPARNRNASQTSTAHSPDGKNLTNGGTTDESKLSDALVPASWCNRTLATFPQPVRKTIQWMAQTWLGNAATVLSLAILCTLVMTFWNTLNADSAVNQHVDADTTTTPWHLSWKGLGEIRNASSTKHPQTVANLVHPLPFNAGATAAEALDSPLELNNKDNAFWSVVQQCFSTTSARGQHSGHPDCRYVLRQNFEDKPAAGTTSQTLPGGHANIPQHLIKIGMVLCFCVITSAWHFGLLAVLTNTSNNTYDRGGICPLFLFPCHLP